MIIDKLQEKKDFTNSEITIADYLLSLTNGVMELSTEDLAKATFTSKATITRFCKRLGCSSYRQFQKELDDDLAQLQRIRSRINGEPLQGGMNYNDIVNTLPEIYDLSVSDAKLHLDSNVVNRIVERLRRAKHIDIYGAGVTKSIADLCAFKFETLGIDCSTRSGLNEHYVIADRMPQDKVVIMFSLSGGSQNMIHIAERLKKRNCYIVGIGGTQYDSLKPMCKEYIALPMSQNVLGGEMIYMINIVNFVVDVLFVSLLTKDFDHYRDVATKILMANTETK